MSEKFKFSKAYPSPYLREADLEGKNATLTIKSWRYIDENKDKGTDGRPMKGTVIAFEGTPKEFVANVGNYKAISRMHGPDCDDWIGKQITLTPETTNLKGVQTPCLRIKQETRSL